MRKILKWFDDHLESVLCVLFMSVMTLVVFVQVIMRYVFGSSLSWSEELARYCFIWLIYVGTALGCKEMQNIKIDAALYLFPKKLRPYIVILGDLCILAFAMYILITGVNLTHLQLLFDKRSPAMQISMAWVNIAPAAGFVLVIIRQIQVVWNKIKALGKEEEGEK